MIITKDDGSVVAANVEEAKGIIKQAVGLGFKDKISDDYAMLFDIGRKRRELVDTLFMRFNIDVIFMDENKTIVEIRQGMRPWVEIFLPKAKFKYAIEMIEGSVAKHGLKVGEHLNW